MTNELQRLEVTNSPGSGNFTLEFDGVWAAAPIPRHPAAGELQNYLEAISTVGAGNVLVGKESNWVYLIHFQNALGDQDVPQLGVDYSLPVGCEVLITTSIEGSANGGDGGNGQPPDGGGELWNTQMIATPCTVQDLQNWLAGQSRVAPGGTQRIITSDVDGIYVDWVGFGVPPDAG